MTTLTSRRLCTSAINNLSNKIGICQRISCNKSTLKEKIWGRDSFCSTWERKESKKGLKLKKGRKPPRHLVHGYQAIHVTWTILNCGERARARETQIWYRVGAAMLTKGIRPRFNTKSLLWCSFNFNILLTKMIIQNSRNKA